MAISLSHSLSECVKLLLTSGASADVSDENGFTPLHFAAAFGHHRLVHNAHNPYSLHQPVSKNSHCYILQPLNIWFHNRATASNCRLSIWHAYKLTDIVSPYVSHTANCQILR